jgi:hypothetical protein
MAKTKLGFDVECPHCGHDRVLLNLRDLSELSCPECGEEFTPAKAVKMMSDKLAAWRRVAEWIRLATDLATPSTDVTE